jgi:hypothetical protein
LLDTSVKAVPGKARLAFPGLGMLSAAPFRAEEFAVHANCTPPEAQDILSALAEEHLLDRRTRRHPAPPPERPDTATP